MYLEKEDKDISLDSLVSCFVAPSCKQRTPSSTSETSEGSHKISENSDSSEDTGKSSTSGKDEVRFFIVVYIYGFTMPKIYLVQKDQTSFNQRI